MCPQTVGGLSLLDSKSTLGNRGTKVKGLILKFDTPSIFSSYLVPKILVGRYLHFNQEHEEPFLEENLEKKSRSKENYMGSF